MDPALAELLSERPPQQLSVTELHSVMTELRSRITLLASAIGAYRTELESRAWDALPDEIPQRSRVQDPEFTRSLCGDFFWRNSDSV